MDKAENKMSILEFGTCRYIKKERDRRKLTKNGVMTIM